MGGGEIFQKYIPDLINNVKIEKVSEADFHTIIINNLVQPFNLIKEAPVRLRLFETEKANYLFIDTNHIFCDAMSKAVFIYDLDKAYAGEELEQDSWFSYLEERANSKFSTHYQESKLYYENLYGDTEWSRYPKTDFSDDSGNKQGLLFREADFSDSDLDILQKYSLTYNEFFSLISLLSTAVFNNSENILNTWTYKGRWKKSHHNIIGNMILDMPVALKLKNLTINQIFESIKKQLKGNLLHRDYSYTMLDEKILEDDILCFIYHEDLYNVPSKINLFESMVRDFNDYSKGNGASDNIIDVELRRCNNGFLILIDYAANKYKSQTIEKFVDIFLEYTHKLLRAMKENKCDEVLF